LIELLVVTALMAIVTATLMPVFAQTREKARQASCLGHLRQIGAAALLYAQDYDERMAGAELGAPPAYFWGDMILPYAKSRGILACPSEMKTLRFANASPGFPEGVSVKWAYHYALNDVRDALGRGVGTAFQNLAAIRRPAETLLVVDGWPAETPPRDNRYERHAVRWVWGYRQPDRNEWEDGNPRHNSGFLFAVCDGHAVWRVRARHLKGLYAGGTQDAEWLALQSE
jgi:hypothetical protein